MVECAQSAATGGADQHYQAMRSADAIDDVIAHLAQAVAHVFAADQRTWANAE